MCVFNFVHNKLLIKMTIVKSYINNKNIIFLMDELLILSCIPLKNQWYIKFSVILKMLILLLT